MSAAYNALLIYVLPLAKKSAISSLSKLDLSAVLAIVKRLEIRKESPGEVEHLEGLFQLT